MERLRFQRPTHVDLARPYPRPLRHPQSVILPFSNNAFSPLINQTQSSPHSA